MVTTDELLQRVEYLEERLDTLESKRKNIPDFEARFIDVVTVPGGQSIILLNGTTLRAAGISDI